MGQIKPDILRQIGDDRGGRQLCRCASPWDEALVAAAGLGGCSMASLRHPRAPHDWHPHSSCTLVPTAVISPTAGSSHDSHVLAWLHNLHVHWFAPVRSGYWQPTRQATKV